MQTGINHLLRCPAMFASGLGKACFLPLSNKSTFRKQSLKYIHSKESMKKKRSHKKLPKT